MFNVRSPHSQSPLPFPADDVRNAESHVNLREFLGADLPESTEELIDRVESMIGRIDELARELNCLGFFDDDKDGPRAA